MTGFTASNAISVTTEAHAAGLVRITFRPDSGRMPGTVITLSIAESKALVEALDHEKDDALGRWRWPENPDYIVYRRQNGSVIVFEESSPTAAITFWRNVNHAEVTSGAYMDAARAYFESHPERKPWQDAKAGDIWAVVQPDHTVERAYRVDQNLNFIDLLDGGGLYGNDVNCIMTARKVWPEDAS